MKVSLSLELNASYGGKKTGGFWEMCPIGGIPVGGVRGHVLASYLGRKAQKE